MASACGEDAPPSSVAGVIVPDGFAVGTVVDDLSGPTQIAPDGAGGFVVAELSGAEGAGTGRVLRYPELAPDDAVVLVEDLLTPTGVAVDGELLWIMEQRRLTVGPLADPTDRTVVLDEMPYNGRSQGTITAVDGGGILYDTSGATAGDRLEPGSGVLWYLAGPDASPEPLATGLKHAYAHTPAGDGRWFVTEISDGTFNGGAPPDELVVAARGDVFAFPRCIGDGEPVEAFGATLAECAAAPPTHALLPPRSTPTSVAVAPWDADSVLVALWNTGEIVRIDAEPGEGPNPTEVFVAGIERPQHLLADGDRLLITDFAGGRILAIEPV